MIFFFKIGLRIDNFQDWTQNTLVLNSLVRVSLQYVLHTASGWHSTCLHLGFQREPKQLNIGQQGRLGPWPAVISDFLMQHLCNSDTIFIKFLCKLGSSPHPSPQPSGRHRTCPCMGSDYDRTRVLEVIPNRLSLSTGMVHLSSHRNVNV